MRQFGFLLSAKGAEYESQGQAPAPKARNMKARASSSAEGAEYESQGQAPNNVRRVAPGMREK
jgi:hypothetical protein